MQEAFSQIIEAIKRNYDTSGRGVLYSVTHAMTQSVLAASKSVKPFKPRNETGEKCHLCGEFEILHDTRYEGDIGASDYTERIKSFWERLKRRWNREPDFGSTNEKLCTICLLKRILYRTFEKDGGQDGLSHVLFRTFHENRLYPSTTRIALFDFFRRNNVSESKEQAAVADQLFDNSGDTLDGHRYESPLTNRDKYYAILLMDGDHMGRLVNGTTLSSTWESVMHPEMVKRLNLKDFDKRYKVPWMEIFESYPKRLLTPAIHAAISESLGDFAVYGVASIVEKHHGKLIYAGGDDVCAVLPLDTVLDAAREIRERYIASFQLIRHGQSDGAYQVSDIGGKWSVAPGKLSIGLGQGEDISISAGILICHHKENLSEMIRNAHELLDGKAKDQGGRNACAIELKKRSGGSRFFVRKWDDPAWESFMALGRYAGEKASEMEALSTSLIYRLERFRDGIEAILKRPSQTTPTPNAHAMDDPTLLALFIEKQLERSLFSGGREKQYARLISDIVTSPPDPKGAVEFNPEGLIVASFLYGGSEI